MIEFSLINIRCKDFAFGFDDIIEIDLEDEYVLREVYKFKCSNINKFKKKIKKLYSVINFSGKIFNLGNVDRTDFLLSVKNIIMRLNYTDKRNQCDICQSAFKSRENFFRHLETQKHLINFQNNEKKINEKNEINELKQNFNLLENRVNKLETIINDNINTPNKYIAFNSENYSINHISNNKLIKYINDKENCILYLIKTINFNKLYEQYNNIVYKNNELVTIFNGSKWIDISIDNALNELYENKLKYLLHISKNELIDKENDIITLIKYLKKDDNIKQYTKDESIKLLKNQKCAIDNKIKI